MLGKWHLGWDPPDMPIHWGFDYFYGIVRHGFILGDSPTDDTSPERVAEKYVSYALDFIAEGPGAPFFVYLAHRDVHEPYHQGYVDAVTRLDRSVGQLLEGLESMGLDRNTLVLFMSDNGPVDRAGSWGPFNGRKGSCEEGAVRVPAAARWPAQRRRPHHRGDRDTLDVFPTLVELAGVELPPGRSIRAGTSPGSSLVTPKSSRARASTAAARWSSGRRAVPRRRSGPDGGSTSAPGRGTRRRRFTTSRRTRGRPTI